MNDKTLTIIIFSKNNSDNLLYNNLLKQCELLSNIINIKKIHNSNNELKNQNEWFNILQNVKTEYVIFLDSTDEITPNFINIIIQLMEKNADLITYSIKMTDSKINKSFIVNSFFNKNDPSHFPIYKFDNNYLEKYNQFPNLWCLWKTKCLLNIPNDECKSYMHMILASIKNCKKILHLENIILILKKYESSNIFLEDQQELFIRNFSKYNNITLKEFNIDDSQIIQFDKIRNFCLENNIKYIKTDQIDGICEWHNNRLMPKIEITENDLLIVSGHSDFPINQQRFSKSSKNLVKWFGQNIEHSDSRLEAIPIGLTNIDTSIIPIHQIIGNTSHILEQNKKNKNYVNMIYLNVRFNDVRDKSSNSEREYLVNICKNNSLITIEQPDRSFNGYKNYLNQIHSHKMVICPRGNGWDTHRIWETLYLKSIPIVKKCQHIHILKIYQ